MEKLQVPENITLRWEAWHGVGRAELVAILTVTGLVTAAGVVFCFISPLETDKLIAMSFSVLSLVFAMGLFTKLDNNQSIFDFLRCRARFRREQQTFQWRRGEVKEVFLFAEGKEERG